MRSVSEETRITMNTRRNFVNYAHVTLHDGTELNLTPSDFRISGNSFTDDWNEGESFQLGSAIGKTATLLLDNTDGRTEEIEGETVVYPHGKFSEYDFYMAYFELYVHLPDATHYQGELIDEIISIGTFTVTTPASHGATIEITGVDNMYMFDRSFNDCTLNFSNGPTLYTILRRCCTDCGVAIGFSSFINQGITVYKKPKDVTYREVVSYIAQLAGCNAIISVTGALTLKYYDMTPINNILDGGRFLPWDGVDNVRDTLDGGSFNPWTGSPDDAIRGGNFTDTLSYHNLTATKGTTVSTDDIHFTGIMVSYEVVTSTGSTETEALHYPNVADWDTYAMHIDDNPFVETQEIANTVATSVWDVISPLTFRIFSCSSIQDPTIEAGDCALVYDVKGNIYPTIITNVRFVTGGMTEVSCTAESPVKQNSRYVNPAARAEAKAIQKQDDYNAMVAHFNELAGSALGYYKTEQVDPTTHATTTYIHDAATLANSTKIIKYTGTGWFISEDGGQSWNSGLDISTSTMLMNLIYVKGLNADWIVAGTVDTNRLNVDGIITAYNSSGTVTISGGKITASSITGTKLANSTVTGAKIASTTIEGGNIATGAISANKIASNAVTADKINANAVTANKIAANAVTADKINASAVTADKINAGAVTATKIGASAVTSAKISTGAVTADKINVNNLKAINVNIGPWTIDDDGFTNGSDAWVEPYLLACGQHGGLLVKSVGKRSGDGHSGYLSVEVNDGRDCIRIGYNYIRKYDSEGDYIAIDWSIFGSDRRLKKNIEDLSLEEAQDLIQNVRPRKFEYKTEQGIRYGFIAQELREILDDDNAIEYGDDDTRSYHAIRYDDFISPLVKVVQSQQAEIDDLKARLEKLESIVNTK